MNVAELKVQLLKGIVENPGWHPDEPIASSTQTALDDLTAEGWIASRLDGWEATSKAVECYPNFYIDAIGHLQGERTAHVPDPPQAASDGPVEEMGLPRIIVGPRQRVEAEVMVTPEIKGSFIVLNSGKAGQWEIEVVVRARPVPE